MYVDLTVDFTPDEAKGYAQIMIVVASADGALVKEELAMIEGLMGRSMMHPEMRVDLRNMLEKPPKLQMVMDRLTPIVLKIALRDAILVAAVDGEYDAEYHADLWPLPCDCHPCGKPFREACAARCGPCARGNY